MLLCFVDPILGHVVCHHLFFFFFPSVVSFVLRLFIFEAPNYMLARTLTERVV